MAEITFVVPGQHATTRGGADTATPGPRQVLPGRVRASVTVVATREAAEPIRLKVTPGTEAVVLHLDGGLSLTLHPDNARDLLLAQPSASIDLDSPPPGVVTVPPYLTWDVLAPEEARGGALETAQRVAVHAFEVLTDLLGEGVPELAAGAIARILDGRVDPGVYQLAREQLTRLQGSSSKIELIPRAAKPALVFVHGAFVETTGTFGKLWEKHPSKVQELFTEYADRVYAFEHPTLGEGPIQNALALASAVEAGTVLHLATHSRGGLIAEVLARVCASDAAADAAITLEADRQALAALRSLVQERGIKVERVVRVACPARGTLLASKRLDALFSIVQWLLQLSGVPVAPEVVEFLGAVAATRLDPARLPGLAAMVPNSELVRWLNSGGEALPSELRVIAGDIEGTTVVGWVKRLVSDLFYWTDNDLIIQTRSMYGGAARESASFFLHAAGEVSHFSYFGNELTARALVDGLTQTQPPGFEPIGPLSAAGKDSSGTRALTTSQPAPNQPALFILPGILGTNLDKNGERLWLSHRLLGRFSELEYSAVDGITAGPPLDAYYGGLARALSSTHEVIPFGFDWRRPLEDEARRLARAIRAALDARATTRTAVRLIAHSMGGLLARTLELRHPEVWNDMMQREGARVVMLGVPNRGAYAPMQVLTGDHTFGNWLTLLGSPLREQEARASVARMPGLLQLQAGLLDGPRPLGEIATWKELAAADLAATKRRSFWHRVAFELGCYEWGIPSEATLQAAVQLRKDLDARQLPFSEKVKLVVGQAWLTPSGFVMGPDGLAYRDDVEHGDGTVTLSSALLSGVEAWVSHAEHSELPARSEDFNAYRDLLTLGTTERLDRLPGGTRSDREAPAVKTVLSRPARQGTRSFAPSHITSLLARPLGDSKTASSSQTRAVRVAVQHGSLKFIKAPLMVGHYESDALSGTERIVDELIGGTMTTALKANAYPYDPGDQRIFANNNANAENPLALPRPKAVIVVGLGNEGKLRPEKLAQSVQQGIVAWAQRLHEDGAREPFELASTLIGSGGVGVSAGAAARAIAQGALDANETLVQCAWPALDKLTLIEVYQERAAEAWRELHVLASSTRGRLQLTKAIDKGTGGILRPLEQDYRGADYDLVTATTRGESPQAGNIYYTLDTRRARAEVRAQATQMKLVREMVKRSANYERAERDNGTGRTLFRLLVPQELRPFLVGEGRLVLQLDQTTAAIPWELLCGSEADDARGQPWAIRTKLLRKFETASYRSQLLDASLDDCFLVIGNPKLSDPRYQPLSGAVTEAKRVSQVLEKKFPNRVTALVSDNDAIEIMNAVFARRYRVVHIAAHGEEGQDKGVVLSDGIYLSAKELGSMAAVPELVFVNCCYLSKAAASAAAAPPGFDAAQFAASVAESLITLGVRCVVAAGWAVGDAAAAEFATAFYQALLAGESFQDAVAEARRAAREKPDNTWAAYQCYGDPNWRLVSGGSTTSRDPLASELEFPTAFSLKLYLDTVITRVKCDGMPKQEALRQIAELVTRFEHWGKQGEVAEAFGNAFTATSAFEAAIEWYRRAIAAEDGAATVHSTEQLANLIARVAWAKLEATPLATPPDFALARSAIDEALRLLDNLTSLSPTSERLSLRGSACKRRALLELRAGDSAAELLALQQMKREYQAAETLAIKEGAPYFYPGQNRVAAELRLSAFGAEPFAPANLASLLEHASSRAKEEPEFWSVVAVTDLQSYEAYATGSFTEKLPGILKDYDDLRRRIPASNQWASVHDTAEFAFGHPTIRARFPDCIDQLLTRLRAFAQGM